ncbi:MAG: LysR family transcriptional regulator [Sneathiella sp.]|uniref:LysR substrate-binding domain-containing protein n=1 Tax=Sneathiella sp. TaxID=1964365 RepID=UPI000C357808|nr:LysR substrate-binding domain-containing protein [Sneathiella sp.]MAZ01652.1 LysR family transcriptional regulator [Sneathiella sp.]
MDQLRAMEIFIAIADSGGFSGAARSLGLSAPSVTRILGELEEELGVLLFHRTTRAVSLTDPGRTFLEDARRITGEYHDAKDAIRGTHREPKGRLRITAPVLFGQHYILPLLTDFLDQYPDTSVEATFLDRIANIVEEGFDIAIRIGPLADSSLIAVRVGSVRRVVCACPSYFEQYGVPQAPSDLARHRIITSSPISDTDGWRFLDNIIVKVKPRFQVNSNSAAIAAAKSGWGLTQVLSYQIGPELGSGGLQTALSEFEPEPLPIHIVHPEGRTASAKVRAFVELARKSIRRNPYLNP